MNIQEAFKIFNISNQFVTKDEIKNIYRRLAKKYHPDRNPNGLRLMQDVNIAYDYLSKLNENDFKNYKNNYYYEEEDDNEPEEFELFHALYLDTKIEDGRYWVYGKTYPHRELLKEYYYRWDPEEKMWWKKY